MPKKLFTIFFVLFAMFIFIVGGILAWFNAISTETYAVAAGIVGSLASTLGLLAFLSPRITGDDVKSIEAALIQNLADAAKSVEEYELKVSENKGKIEELTRERLQVELLVRQASIKIFLEEKAKRLAEEIDEIIKNNNNLANTLAEYERTTIKSKKLSIEIEASPKAELIKSIVREAESQRPRYFITFGGRKVDVTPFTVAVDMLSGLMVGGVIRR